MKKFAFVAVALAFTSLTPAWADGGPPSTNQDTGGTSTNPDTGGTAAKPDGGSGPAPVVTLAAKSSASPSGNGSVPPTLVQQLQAKAAYQQAEVDEGNTKYYGPALKRTLQQLAAAQVAETAGTPLPPILSESGVPVPVSQYAHTSYEDEITSLY
jgi:hypothetical protein